MSDAEPERAAPDEPAVAPPAGVAPEPEPSGVRLADEAREQLRTVEDAPLEEHVPIFEDVHRRLQEGLADLDDG